MRTKVDWSSGSAETYSDFCNTHPNLHLSAPEWRNIVYTFNEYFRDYLLETGDRVKFPNGFGEFSIVKSLRRRTKKVGDKEFINLPIDWVKSKQKGKRIYNMNYHTEGYYFGYKWFVDTARFKFYKLWYFKASRASSRLLAHYIKVSPKYQQLYKEWNRLK